MAIVINGTGTISGISATDGLSSPQTGSVLQVVTYTDTTLRSTTSNSAVASGFSASITPKFSTSKILIIFNGSVAATQGTNGNIIGTGSVYRGSSTQLTACRWGYSQSAASGDFQSSLAMSYLDSPATTSSVTYNLYWSRYNSTYDATLYLNTLAGPFGQGSSTFVLMEIAG